MARKNEAEIILTARDRTKSAFASVNRGLGRVAAVGLAGAVAGTVLLTRESLKMIDALAKEAKLLGITTEKLSALKLQSAKAGVENKTLEKSLINVTRVVAEAAEGTGLAVDTLKKLGLEAKELSQQTPDEQMKRIAEAMKGLNTQSEKVLASYELFGGRGAALLRVLEDGAKGFEDAERRVKEYGTAISAVDAASVEEANDAFTDLKESVKGLGFDLARRFAPGMKDANEGLATFVAGIRRDFIPAMALLFEQLGIVQNNVRGLSDIELAVRVEVQKDAIAQLEADSAEAQRKADAAREQAAKVGDDEFGTARAAFRQQANLQEIVDEKAQAEARLAEVQAEQQRRAQIILDADAKLAETRRQQAMENAAAIAEAERVAEEEKRNAFIDSEIEHLDRVNALRQKAARNAAKDAEAEAKQWLSNLNNQRRQEQRAAQDTIRLRQATAQTSINILQTLAGKNKTVARALFLAEKGLAIARTVQNTAAAQVRALADLGPVAGPPAAAAIGAYGAAQIGLIAATALTGVGNVGGGGAGAIGGGGAGFGSSETAPAEAPGPSGSGITQQGTVQLIFPSLFGITPDAIDALADALREASENRDVVIVGGVGRNAEILQGANG